MSNALFIPSKPAPLCPDDPISQAAGAWGLDAEIAGRRAGGRRRELSSLMVCAFWWLVASKRPILEVPEGTHPKGLEMRGRLGCNWFCLSGAFKVLLVDAMRVAAWLRDLV